MILSKTRMCAFLLSKITLIAFRRQASKLRNTIKRYTCHNTQSTSHIIISFISIPLLLVSLTITCFGISLQNPYIFQKMLKHDFYFLMR